MLTRLLPFIYEADSLGEWEERFFWGAGKAHVKRSRNAAKAEVLFDGAEPAEEDATGEAEVEATKPLAEELIDTLIDLLYLADFTIPRAPGKRKVSFTIWQSGVGCNSSIVSSPEYESRRMEVLRLLLTLTSKSMYTPTSK